MNKLRFTGLGLALILIFSQMALAQRVSRPPAVIHWRNAITATEIREYLSHSHNLREWNRNVAVIIELNSGKLPSFWQREIIDSQFFDGLRVSWGNGNAQEP